MKKIIYRVKDLDGNRQDFNSIDEIAKEFGLNYGTIKNKILNTDRLICGLKIYTVDKKETTAKKTKRTNKTEGGNVNED